MIQPQAESYDIKQAVLEDAIGIGEMHLQSWLETYPNKELAISKEWIRDEFGFLNQERGIEFRRNTIKNLNKNVLYLVVKNKEGIIKGFLHASRDTKNVSMNAIYLLDELKGKGIAQKLMDRAITFSQSLPISLEVVAYNERAIRFYEKYGFKRIEISKELFHSKLPVLKMHKEKQ